MKLTPDIENAMRRAGLHPEQLKAKRGKKRRKAQPLPDYCLLDPGEGPGRYEVEIPAWHPARLNQLMHARWGGASRMKRKDAEIIGAHLRRAGVPRATGKRRVGLVIVLGKGQRGADPDAYNKSFLDGAKRSGALKDDNRQWVDVMPTQYERSILHSCRIILEDVV